MGKPLAAIAVLVFVLGFVGCLGEDNGEPAAVASVPSKSVLSRPPYMGVACRVPNSPKCDRVGLAVWLKEPAQSVDATIAGRTFGLDNENWSEPPRHGLRDSFAGFVEPANLTERPLGASSTPVSLRAKLLIVGADGTPTATNVKLGVAGGWG